MHFVHKTARQRALVGTLLKPDRSRCRCNFARVRNGPASRTVPSATLVCLPKTPSAATSGSDRFGGIASLSVLMIALRIAGAFRVRLILDPRIHGRKVCPVLRPSSSCWSDSLKSSWCGGYSQWVLSQGMNFWPAAALLSAGFGALHSSNPGESKAGLIAAALIGFFFFFCLTLRRTGDLWWGRRLSHVVGLGRELLLFRPRQRRHDARPPLQLIIPRSSGEPGRTVE